MDYEKLKAKRCEESLDEIVEMLTTFFDKCEEALQTGEGLEETLEFIGLKSDELLQKI